MNRAALVISLAALGLGLVLALTLATGSPSPRPAVTNAQRPVTTALRSPSAAGREALALVSTRAAPLGYRIRFAQGRTGVRAGTDRDTRTITVFVRPNDLPSLVAHDIAHEIGHAFDDRRMSAASRRAYLRARGVAGATWWPGGRSDYAVGAGDFAEVFALCHAPNAEFRSTLAPRPDNPCALLPAAALSQMRAKR